MSEIKKLRDIDHSEAANVLVYGAAGTGKTTLIGTLPEPVLVLSAESGLMSLAASKGDIDVMTIADVEDLRSAYKMLAKTEHRYKWVALDSVSEIAEVVLAAEKTKSKDPRAAYGALIDSMTSLLKAFRDLPIGVYMTCKEARDKDEATGRIMQSVGMPGAKLAQAIPYLFDEVLRLVVIVDKDSGERVRMLQTSPDATSDAKDRSGKLDAFEPADLGAILQKLNGKQETKKASKQ